MIDIIDAQLPYLSPPSFNNPISVNGQASLLVSDVFICIDCRDKFQSHQMKTAKATIEILLQHISISLSKLFRHKFSFNLYSVEI